VRVTDAANNSTTAKCSATVTVRDTLPPQFTVNNPVSVKAGDRLTPEQVIAPSDLFDNCTSNDDMLDTANHLIRITPDVFACDDRIGDASATITVSDRAGNSTSASFTVHVEVMIPVITCAANDTVFVDAGECEYKVAGTRFNPDKEGCGVLTLSHDHNDGGTTLEDLSFTVGVHVITWTVTDEFGGSATCAMTIRVDDKEAPEVILKPDTTLYLDANGSVTADARDWLEAVIKECAPHDSLTYLFEAYNDSTHAYACDDTAGVKSEIIWVTDLSGNSATYTVNIIVKDTLPPSAEPKSGDEDGNIPLWLDASGTITLTREYIIDYLLHGPPADNCTDSDQIAISSVPDMFIVSDMGNHEVVVRLEDLSGNTYSVTVKVMVEDDVTQRETGIEKYVRDKYGNYLTNSIANVEDTVTFVIKITNVHGGDRNLVIVDHLPEGLRAVDVPDNSSIDLAGRVITLRHDALAPEGTKTYVITAKIERTGLWENRAYLYRYDLLLDEATATVQVTQPELELTAKVRDGDYTNTEASPAIYNVPGDYRLIIGLENTSGDLMADRPLHVRVTYNPSDQQFVGSSRGGDVTDNSGSITWTMYSLAGQEELELRFVPLRAIGSTFTAEVDILPRENPDNNAASVLVNQAIIKVPNVVTSDNPKLYIEDMENEAIMEGTIRVVNTWGNQVYYVRHRKETLREAWFDAANVARGTYWYELVVRYEDGRSYVIKDYVEVLK
jgi:hypothetical protein